MRLQVNHRTSYKFDPPMRGVAQSLRLWPSLFEGQTVIDWDVDIEGAFRGANFRDGAGDLIETATFLGSVETVVVKVSGTVETTDLSGVLKGHREKVPPMAYVRRGPFTHPSAPIRELAHSAVEGVSEPLAQAHALANAIGEAIAYTPGETDAQTTAAQALEAGHGVCQDHAHALVAAAICLDVPA
ncbi:MAG: transglutaminase family protein, partial [Boseongicola sp.]|nr:transglutaminase family protein [Boseongicola sp.]